MSNVQFQNATFTRRVCVGKIQTAESVRISVKNDIQQVLSVGVDSIVNSYEVSSGEATFYGKTNIKFLYSDGVSLNSSSYNADFTASLADDIITPESKLTFDVVTVDSKTDTNANTATLTILLEITVYAYASVDSTYLQSGEDVFLKTDNVEILQSVGVYGLPTVIDEELNASRNISTVLLAESSLCIGEYSKEGDVLRIKGEATTRLTYVADGEIVTDVLPFAFERELDADAIPDDSQLRLSVTPRSTKVRLDISQEVNTAFTVEIAATVRVEAAKLAALEFVVDAYGENCDYVFTKRTVTTTLPCGSAVARKKTYATLPSEEGKTPITAVNVGGIVTKCASGERSATVDGVAYATLLSSTDTGTEGSQIEIPFSQTIEVDYLMPQCRSFAAVTVSDFKVTESNGLQVEAELCFTIDGERQVEYQLITDATEQPFDKRQLPAIEVCLAKKGETLWNLAKNLHMSQDDLLSVNPEITNPLEQDARIVVYNKI